ncbi:uncharacterized protein LOC120842270 [Ixodes scapularis]|uniref:uncharacterized protein LOC120842270 n=1 Tax=Ixodes scapularis TaxID=6945 RepID=UPI001C391E57|nr:uncharacterized protein LOC120842270 [Ixodes scapularis]
MNTEQRQITVVQSAALPPPPPFLAVPGPPPQAWPAWKETFMSFLGAAGLEGVDPKRKKQILFSLLGIEGQRIVSAFGFTNLPHSELLDEFETFLAAVESHFVFSGSLALERKKLRLRVQQPGESVTEFLAALRHQHALCAFEDGSENTRLCDLFLDGLISRRVQDRILRDCVGRQVPTLERAIQLALQFEQLARTAEQYHQPPQGEPVASCSTAPVQYVAGPETEQVQAAARHDDQSPALFSGDDCFSEHGARFPSWPRDPTRHAPRSQWGRPGTAHAPRPPARQSNIPHRDPPPARTGPQQDNYSCWFCGRRNHARENCPALNSQCFQCGKIGHFAVWYQLYHTALPWIQGLVNHANNLKLVIKHRLLFQGVLSGNGDFQED